MQTLIHIPLGFYSREEAEKIAKTLNEGELDGWCYKAKHDPKGTGLSFVEAYDEEGIFVRQMF